MKMTKGFTLVEILIALSIFAILATLTSSILYSTFNTRQRVNIQAERLRAIQFTVTFLSRDSAQIINRAVRKDAEKFSPPFIGQANYIEFTRAGVANPEAREKRSTLSRVAWLCRQHQLIRRNWPSLDTPKADNYEEKVLLSKLKNCEFAYLNQHLQTLPSWHEQLQQQPEQEPFPKAFRLNLLLENKESLSFLFIIPIGLYEAKR